MCLITRDPSIKIAEKDIYVYKNCDFPKSDTCDSMFKCFIYERGKMNKHVDLIPEQGGENWYEVHHGYHSYNEAKKGNSNTRFKIPQGAKYIDGFFADFGGPLNRVSSSIIYLGRIRWYHKLLYKIGVKNF